MHGRKERPMIRRKFASVLIVLGLISGIAAAQITQGNGVVHAGTTTSSASQSRTSDAAGVAVRPRVCVWLIEARGGHPTVGRAATCASRGRKPMLV